MKALIVAAAVAITGCGALAQGRFIFGNKCVTCAPPIDAKVFAVDGVTPLEGTAYYAQAYVKLASGPDSSYAAVGQPVHFQAADKAGYVQSVEVVTLFPANTEIHVQMRAWEVSGGDSYEEAIVGSGHCGSSWAVVLTVMEPPDPAPHMLGLQSFSPSHPTPPAVPPSIISQPTGVRVAVDSYFALSVSAADAAPSGYQWYRDGQSLPGENASTLSVIRAQLTNAGDYQVTVSNAEGSATSEVARVVVGYTLNLSVSRGGTIDADPALDVYAPGQVVEVTAIPRAGRTFLGWEGDALDTANPLTFAMDRARHLRARFSGGPGDLKWQFATGGPVQSSPAIGTNGTVYVGSGDSNVYAVNGVTGQQLWAHSMGAAVSSSPVIGPEATVYVVVQAPADVGHLFLHPRAAVLALDGVNGREVWLRIPGDVSNWLRREQMGLGWIEILDTTGQELAASSPLVVGRDGTLFGGGLKGAIELFYTHGQPAGTTPSYVNGALGVAACACRGATGEELWWWAAEPDWSGPVVFTALALGEEGTLHVVSSAGGLYAVEAATGQVKSAWRTDSPPEQGSSLALGADRIAYVGRGRALQAFSFSRGQVHWEFTTGGPVRSTPAIGADGTVYVGSDDHRVYALRGDSGQRLWEFETGSNVVSSPAVGADGTVYVGSHDRRLYALEGATGRLVWEFETGGSVQSSPAIGADGTAYVGSDDGTLYALASASVGGLASSPWPKYRGDAQNSGRVTPPAPLAVSISRHEGKARIAWTAPAVLQSSDAFVPGDWQDVSEATSPYEVERANAQRFYRLRRPRRARCARRAGQPRARWQANGLRHRSRGQRPRATVVEVRALKGQTNSLAAGGGPGLAWPLQGVETLEAAGSEGDALGYGRGRPSGAGQARSAAYVQVPRHRPWDRSRCRIPRARSTRVAVPAVGAKPRAASGVRRFTGAFRETKPSNAELTRTRSCCLRHVRKSLALAAAVGLAVSEALAQGRFILANKCRGCTPPVDVKATGPDGTTGLEGTAYWAQAYVKLACDPPGASRPIGVRVHFLTGNDAGYIRPVEMVTPWQTVELTAIASAGAAFERWQGDVSSTANPIPLTMDGPKQVQAWFSAVPLRLTVSRQQGGARLEWTPSAVLQASDALVPGDWQDLSEATSPYDVEPADAQRFYRLRRPRRPRRGQTGAAPCEASGSAAGPCRSGWLRSARRRKTAPEAWRTPKRDTTPGAGGKPRAALGARRFAGALDPPWGTIAVCAAGNGRPGSPAVPRSKCGLLNLPLDHEAPRAADAAARDVGRKRNQRTNGRVPS